MPEWKWLTRRDAKGGRLTRVLRALPLAVLAAACSHDPGTVLTADPNTPPANYRAEILAYLRSYLNNPSGVRGAFIAEPELRDIPGSSVRRYSVCLRFNTRTSAGKYEGSRDRLVVFLAGRLDTLVPAAKEQCANANWQPFPELEKLKR